MSGEGAQAMQELLDALDDCTEALKENTEATNRLRKDILDKMSAAGALPGMASQLLSRFMGGGDGDRRD